MIPIDEILLTAGQAKITGGDWRVAKNAELPAGATLESATVFRRASDMAQISSYVTLNFEAEANRDYYVWVRGACLGTGSDRGLQDGLVVKFARAQTTQPKLAAEWGSFPGPDSVGLAGWGRFPGTRWMAGDGDLFDAKGVRVEVSNGTGRPGDEMPCDGSLPAAGSPDAPDLHPRRTDENRRHLAVDHTENPSRRGPGRARQVVLANNWG
jgi:hypothetical protein